MNQAIPVRRRLMRMLLLTSGVAILFTCSLFIGYEFFIFRESLERQLATLGRAIAANSTAALAFDNPDDARTVLAAFRADPHIVAAALYDRSGTLFASYPEGVAQDELPSSAQATGYRFEGGRVVGFEPVREGTQLLGTLYVSSDLKAIDQRLQLYAFLTVVVLLLSGVVAFFVSRRQQQQISQPILDLAEIARAVSDRQDYSVRAQHAGTYEIDLLTDAFNHMLTQIGRSEVRLRAQMGRLSLLHHITTAIGDRQDLPSIFQVVLRNVEENLPVDFGCICLYDAEAAVLTVNTVGAASREIAPALQLTEGAAVTVDPRNGLARCLRGELVCEPDTGSIPSEFPQRLAASGLHAVVIAPLMVEAHVFGLLIAARNAAGSFSSGDCEFLKQLSGHVALASHQTQLHNALQQAFDDLRRSQHTVMQQERLRALGQMASGIAHDINNALSPVSLYTESLLERESNLSERARTSLTIIQRAIDDVAGTVARMREFYRQREPQLTLALVDLNKVAEQVIELTRARWSDLSQKQGIDIQLQAELADGLPGIMGAEGEIRDALTNLLFNAVDAMPEGGTLTLRTQSTESAPDVQLVSVVVSDNGIGMDEETRRRCLEPFYTTKGERGTGLGLAMVYGMVQRHSAEFAIDSAPGKGTSVTLTFPAYTQNFTSTTRVATPTLPGPRLRILLIDDDPIIIKALEEALGGDGHVTVAAGGGQAGIDAFRSALGTADAFALVITDLGMPRVDGRKVASTVKSLSPRTPVILLTGWGQRMLADSDIPPHVDRLLSKPPRLQELRRAIKELAS